MSVKQTKIQNKRRFRPNRTTTIIILSLAAFILGPIVSLFLVYGTTTFLNIEMGLSELIITTPYNMIISMLGYPIILYFLIIINNKMYEKDLTKFGFSTKNIGSKIAKGIVIGTILAMSLYLSSTLLSTVTISVNSNSNTLIILLFIIGFFFQGMAEEVLMRSIIMKEIQNKTNLIIAIVSNSLIFSLFHLSAPGVTALPVINLFLFGIMFSLIYYTTNNMWLTGFAHGAWNIVLGVFIGTEISGQVIENSLFRTISTPLKLL
ncbi:CPBP family intramembrane glutamic endopeptidase [Vagococcus carniphilus]|uniref:CPBP family intramembrane glutamic endopeptidase n=1 Tax=Vagococcus carniphilus TaxID=218144 RepID=UPI001FE9C853|nr:type II CAAX endopeptidase family protein [Vagococcus carniphilus]